MAKNRLVLKIGLRIRLSLSYAILCLIPMHQNPSFSTSILVYVHGVDGKQLSIRCTNGRTGKSCHQGNSILLLIILAEKQTQQWTIETIIFGRGLLADYWRPIGDGDLLETIRDFQGRLANMRIVEGPLINGKFWQRSFGDKSGPYYTTIKY